MDKKLKRIICLIAIILIISNSIIYAYGSDESTITSEKIAYSFASVLRLKGWNTQVEANSVNAWIFDPSYQALNIAVEYRDRDGNTFTVTIASKRNSKELSRVFTFDKRNYSNLEQVNNILVPYLMSLAGTKDKDQSPYYISARAGYSRTNEKNKSILPSINTGTFFIGLDFLYDPAKNARTSVPLYIGDYLDSSFSFSFLDRNVDGYQKFLDEFTLDIDLILYGKSKKQFSGQKGSRNLYGLFTTASYYRPYVKTTAVMWYHNIYPDHMHIQYCYWLPVLFMQQLTFTNNEKSISFRYKTGIGPCQNSSLTATGIEHGSDRELNLNPIFTSRWYFKNNEGDRKHNYYYSITTPIKLEFESDRYFNSRFKFKYHFYYFQAIKDKNTQDFLNRIILNYDYYLTKNITAGIGYEFWHVKGIENEYRKSHFWNRLNIQMEIKI